MNWPHKFAQRTELMRRTAIRELLKVTNRPEIISFAGGLPAAELFPLAQVQQACTAVLQQIGGQSLQYAETEGIAELRDWIAARFSRPGLRVGREHVLITSGAQQALDLIGRVLLDEGDEVVVENPTYLALLTAWRPYGARFQSVPSDAEGIQVDALPAILAGRPKLLYLVPNFQNPQGTTLALARRERLARLLREYDVALVEDNPYGELRYDGSPLPHLVELDARHVSAAQLSATLETRVIYTGTFSKVLMPGLRVGWVIAAAEVIDKLVQAKQAADLHTGTLSQYLALELVRTGFLEQFVPRLQQAYAERRDRMLQALEKHFPEEATWTRPQGGMFLLVTLPEHINAGELLTAALKKGVAFVPGEEFHLDGAGKNTLRLNFSNARPEQIEPGIKRLAEACRMLSSKHEVGKLHGFGRNSDFVREEF